MGDYQGALLRYQDATAVDPTNVDAIFGLAETQQMLKKNADAAPQLPALSRYRAQRPQGQAGNEGAQNTPAWKIKLLCGSYPSAGPKL